LNRQGKVSVKLFDILGREVSTVLNRQMNAGRHEIAINAENLASGIYFVSLESGVNRVSKKIVLIR
jgi:hypothetical protein